MLKLTATMQKALKVIAEGEGQVAVPKGGGYWTSADGELLEFAVDDWRKTDAVGTSTIYALEERGLLLRLDDGQPAHRLTYRITEKGEDYANAS